MKIFISLEEAPMFSLLLSATIVLDSYVKCSGILDRQINSYDKSTYFINNGSVEITNSRGGNMNIVLEIKNLNEIEIPIPNVAPVGSSITFRSKEKNRCGERVGIIEMIRIQLPPIRIPVTPSNYKLVNEIYKIPLAIKAEKPYINEIVQRNGTLNTDNLKSLIEKSDSTLKVPFCNAYAEICTEKEEIDVGSLLMETKEVRTLICTMDRFFENQRKNPDVLNLVRSVSYFNKGLAQLPEKEWDVHPFMKFQFFRHIFLAMASPKISTEIIETFVLIPEDSRTVKLKNAAVAKEYFRSENNTRDFKRTLENTLCILRDPKWIQHHSKRYVETMGNDARVIEMARRFDLEYKVLTHSGTSYYILKSVESLTDGIKASGGNFKTRVENILSLFTTTIFSFMKEIIAEVNTEIPDLNEKINALNKVHRQLIDLHNEIAKDIECNDPSHTSGFYEFYGHSYLLTYFCSLLTSIMSTIHSTQVLDIQSIRLDKFFRSLVYICTPLKRVNVLLDLAKSLHKCPEVAIPKKR